MRLPTTGESFFFTYKFISSPTCSFPRTPASKRENRIHPRILSPPTLHVN